MSDTTKPLPITAFDRCVKAMENDPALLDALDQLAAEVSDVFSDFCVAELALLRKHGFLVTDVEQVAAMAVGWVLGVDVEDHLDTATRIARLQERVRVAAFAAGFASRSEAERERRSGH